MGIRTPDLLHAIHRPPGRSTAPLVAGEGLTCDDIHLGHRQDEADRRNRKISCPVLFLWSQRGSIAKLYDDPPAIWQQWAYDVRGAPVPVGHFIPEEAAQETTRQLLNFLQ
jgi:pimeloyl-ACP methyl ester carboxylesterase